MNNFQTFFSHKANWQKKSLISTQTEYLLMSFPTKKTVTQHFNCGSNRLSFKNPLAKLVHFELVVPIRNSVRKRRSAHLSPPIRALDHIWMTVYFLGWDFLRYWPIFFWNTRSRPLKLLWFTAKECVKKAGLPI